MSIHIHIDSYSVGPLSVLHNACIGLLRRLYAVSSLCLRVGDSLIGHIQREVKRRKERGMWKDRHTSKFLRLLLLCKMLEWKERLTLSSRLL